MRKVWIAGLFFMIFLSGISSAEETVSLKTQKDKISYIIGMDAGGNLKAQSIDVDADIFMKGFKDGISGKKSVLSDDETSSALAVLKEEMMKKHAEELERISENNKKEGAAFLAENRKKVGVVTLPSGLQYKVLKEGDGPAPNAKDSVTVNYRGTLIDGTEFDSSYKRNQPATFQVEGVIPGWTEALQMMKVGSKWQLFVPASLAYAERGAGNIVAPNATLIFEVELLSIGEPGPGQQGGKEIQKGHGHH